MALVSTLLLAVIIAWGTLSPTPPTPDLDIRVADKVYHAVAFAALAFPAAWLHARSLLWLLPVALFFDVAIEVIQPYVSREAEAADVAADAVGLALGTALGLASRKWLRHSA